MNRKRNNTSMGGSRKHAAAPLANTAKASTSPATSPQRKTGGLVRLLFPVPLVVFLLVWLWAAWWQGDVFRMVRENSFFAPDTLLMRFEMDKSYGILWTVGRALLTPFRYPWLGGALLSLMLTASCWLLGYALRLTPRWRWVQYLPLVLFTGLFTWQGANNWFEAESGHVMGIPFCILLILVVWGVIIRSFSHKPTPAIFRIPQDETPWQNRFQLLTVLLTILVPAVWGHFYRPCVRPLAKEQVAVMNQDWEKVIEVAHAHAELSNRPMAAQYAIALVQTGQIADKLFDIRLDYDKIHATGYNEDTASTVTTGMYLMECDYHAGLVQTAYHHAMESMAMEGPTLRNLKMLCKASLLRSEWEVAEKYLTILSKVPFEGDFVEKYQAMLRRPDRVNADKEMARVRLTEPVHDAFENRFLPPVFLGYNADLLEGRSIQALHNALMVSIYTKKMPDFLFRSQPLRGTTPPVSFAEALLLLSGKNPEILQQFSNLEMYRGRLTSFLEHTRQYLTTPEERAARARELFPQYKGYYPYYYFFGNLKATKKRDKAESSNAGVN